jgi:hypothetical protein
MDYDLLSKSLLLLCSLHKKSLDVNDMLLEIVILVVEGKPMNCILAFHADLFPILILSSTTPEKARFTQWVLHIYISVDTH